MSASAQHPRTSNNTLPQLFEKLDEISNRINQQNSSFHTLASNVNNTLPQLFEKLDEKLDEISNRINQQNISFFTTTLISIIAIIVPVLTAILLFWSQQDSIMKDSIRRSCETILKELDGTTEALIGDIRQILSFQKQESCCCRCVPFPA
jgi:predicted PurR-regulated permease PerM